MAESYPNYMPEFQALEAIPPSEDIACLKCLRVLEFATREQAWDKNSPTPDQVYIASE